MKRVKIKGFRIMTVAFNVGVVLGLLGIIIGLLGSIVGGIHGGLMAPMGSASLFGFGIIGILLLPIIFFTFGFLLGGSSAYFYNLVAGWIGGIEVQISENEIINE